MNKKGFTLIELLAVIVILAVIALIVTPIVTGIIASAKEAANARSVEGHIKSVEYAALQIAFTTNGSTTVVDGVKDEDALRTALGADKYPQNNDAITCDSYEIVNGLVKSASICTVSGWGYAFNYTKGANAVKSTTYSE